MNQWRAIQEDGTMSLFDFFGNLMTKIVALVYFLNGLTWNIIKRNYNASTHTRILKVKALLEYFISTFFYFALWTMVQLTALKVLHPVTHIPIFTWNNSSSLYLFDTTKLFGGISTLWTASAIKYTTLDLTTSDSRYNCGSSYSSCLRHHTELKNSLQWLAVSIQILYFYTIFLDLSIKRIKCRYRFTGEVSVLLEGCSINLFV